MVAVEWVGETRDMPLPHAREAALCRVGPQHGLEFVSNFAVLRAASHLSCTISLQLTPVLPLNWFRCAGARVKARLCHERSGYNVSSRKGWAPCFPRFCHATIRLRLFGTP
jgi:hypothetical protein